MAKKANKYIARRFDSIADYESYLTRGTVQPSFEKAPASQRDGEDATRFTGTVSYEEANGLLMYGDRSLAKRIEEEGVGKTRAALMAKAQQIKTEASVVGFMPHVPNFIAGVPLTMINATRMERRAKALSIVYNIAAACDIDAEAIIKASATVLAAIMRIEASGTRCNIYAGADIKSSYERGKGQHIAAFVRLKSSDKKMDVVRCAYMFAHSSSLRRHIFRFVEVTEGVPASMVDGYGWPVKRSEDVQEVIEKGGLGMQDSIVLSYYEVEGKTIDEVGNMIQQRAKEGRR